MFLLTVAVAATESLAALTLYPVRDGTIADGGVFGVFDGVPDAADYSFNGSSFEGAMTLSRATPATSLEHRVFWEYSLGQVTLHPPITATLRFAIRGAPVFPAPDAEINVYAYPADLTETLDDFSAGPAVLVGTVRAPPFSPATIHSLDVSLSVNQALSDETNMVAFRFQIDTKSEAIHSQAFIDAVDSERTTKPALILEDVVPGDGNGDRAVDLHDYAIFADCMAGPATAILDGCEAFDFNHDGRIDLFDARIYAWYLTGQ